MNIQDIFNAVSGAARDTRSRYHLTLGKLRVVLETAPQGAVARFDHGAGVGSEHSYRGYYSDLSFQDGEASTVADLRRRCESALGATYVGYKGGDFVMGADTPLWNAAYGGTGLAIVGAEMVDGDFVLHTREVD